MNLICNPLPQILLIPIWQHPWSSIYRTNRNTVSTNTKDSGIYMNLLSFKPYSFVSNLIGCIVHEKIIPSWYSFNYPYELRIKEEFCALRAQICMNVLSFKPYSFVSNVTGHIVHEKIILSWYSLNWKNFLPLGHAFVWIYCLSNHILLSQTQQAISSMRR